MPSDTTIAHYYTIEIKGLPGQAAATEWQTLAPAEASAALRSLLDADAAAASASFSGGDEVASDQDEMRCVRSKVWMHETER